MGLIACMMMPLFTKVQIVSMSPFEWVANPKILLEKIDEYKCTHLWQPNFAFGHLTKSINKSKVNKFDLL